MVPTQSANGVSAFNATSDATHAATPCNSIPKFWKFNGACLANSLTSAGATIKLAPYMGYQFTTMIGKNNAKGKVPFILGDATGKGDITGTYKGMAFPPYGGSRCVSGSGQPETCPGKAFLYIEAINGGKSTVTLTTTPGLTVALSGAAKFPGKALCFPGVLTSKGWLPEQAIGAKPTSKKLTIGSFPIKFPLPPGGVILSLNCQ